MKTTFLVDSRMRAPALICAALILTAPPGYGVQQKTSREEAEFNISVAGKEIGREKFVIETAGDSVSSRSTTSFHDPANKRQTVKIETELKMDSGFVPRDYQLRTDVDGQKGMMKGTFGQGEVMFEYLVRGNPRKSGLLVGQRYSILDTNVFHHFAFIGRMFDFNSREKTQSMEVVIPQELDNGVLKISDVGKEKVSVGGKKRELHHLKADSGVVQIDLWIDDQRVLYKLALPTRKIEVIRH
jgi:hypothetical protein